MVDHFDLDMIAASLEVMQPILLEHGYGVQDVAQLNQDCITEASRDVVLSASESHPDLCTLLAVDRGG